MTDVDIFHLGPPKTATTWLYECLREHPEVATAKRDAVHYYDMFYGYGPDWYARQFPAWRPGLRRFDATPSYIQCRKALERLIRDNPHARLIVGLREPIERAFSHYWHLKKKREITYGFEQTLDNYTLFSLWLEPGFIARNLAPVLEVVPRQRLYVMRYDELALDPVREWLRVLRFCGLDDSVRPRALEGRVNVAGPERTIFRRAMYKAGRLAFGARIDRPGGSALLDWLSGKSEYHRGVPGSIMRKLEAICEPEIREIENLLDLDLSAWRTRREPAGEDLTT